MQIKVTLIFAFCGQVPHIISTIELSSFIFFFFFLLLTTNHFHLYNSYANHSLNLFSSLTNHTFDTFSLQNNFISFLRQLFSLILICTVIDRIQSTYGEVNRCLLRKLYNRTCEKKKMCR